MQKLVLQASKEKRGFSLLKTKMLRKLLKGYRKYVYLLLLLLLPLLYLYFTQPPIKSRSSLYYDNGVKEDIKIHLLNFTEQKYCKENAAEENYLVHSSKCNIPNVVPFNIQILPYFKPKKYYHCSDKPLLTYIKKRNNIATLYVNETAQKEYPGSNIRCCYKGVSSGTSDYVKLSSCVYFENSVQLQDDVVVVWCRIPMMNWVVYKNVHHVVTVVDELRKKLQKSDPHLSILIVGIDGVSRLNMIRSLPHAYNYIKKIGWIEFKGFNKIGENTFPNLMGLMTGMNLSTVMKVCEPLVREFDDCDMLWYDYRRLGFVTAYAEDESIIDTFHYGRAGFRKKPTDYYLRPYVLTFENNLKVVKFDEDSRYCAGPETTGERIMNSARDFATTFLNYSSFGLFWMNSFSHNEISSVSRMNAPIFEFLMSLNRTGVLDNTLLLFMSDHGMRFGDVMYTRTGWLEDKLPFLYMSVPKWFQRKYPRKYSNLVLNANRLVTTYDLYMTLQEILVLSGKKYSIKQSSACPKCRSLFKAVDSERSCEDAGINSHWCSCRAYSIIPSNGVIAIEIAKFILREVNTFALDIRCAQFEIENILSASIIDNCDISNRSHLYFMLTVQAFPQAVFQGTVSVGVDVPTFQIEGSVSRLDFYRYTSQCVADVSLKKYCYCQGSLAFISGIFNKVVSTLSELL